MAYNLGFLPQIQRSSHRRTFLRSPIRDVCVHQMRSTLILVVKILTIRQKSVWGSRWAGSHGWPSGVLGESLELGRRCSHYMAPLWVCLHIDLNKHFKKERTLGPSSPTGEIAASGSEIKGSSPAISLVTQGSSPLGDPS